MTLNRLPWVPKSLRFADSGSSLCELHGQLCVRKIRLSLTLWELAYVSFSISEMGIITFLAESLS